MDILPVIDVRNGTAVHAVRGERAGYRPLASGLAAGSDPVDVARGLCSLFPFSKLYIADIDGIEGRGPNSALAGRLERALPGIGLWLDDGSPAHTMFGQSAAVTPVIGSESLGSEADVGALRALGHDSYVLSLDFKGNRFEGPPAVLAEPQHWPRRVIVMTLARVGSGEGPDLKRIADVLQVAGARAVYAAGGVRHARDIAALAELGAAGVLVASALHVGAITAGDLQEIAGR